jgi:N-acetyl sugar amidotransferase
MRLFRCSRCLYPNVKPDLYFDEDGLCSACQAFDARQGTDWKAKEAEFLDLVKSNAGKTHDVIVACSGGKDSTWQVIKCLELGLKPLAVTATTDHLTELGRKNLNNISKLCDHIEITPNTAIRKKISAFALREVGDISWCEHHLIWSVPAREAVARNIPIVLYGECPQNEYGAGPKGSESQTRLTKSWVHEFGGLLGLRLSDVAEILEIDPRHLEIYQYPEGKFQSVFMGAYFDWDGYTNYLDALKHGFAPYHAESIGCHENLDNAQTGIHDHLRFLKFGYTREDDIVSSHIRRGRMTREEGAEKAFAGRPDYKYYLGIPRRHILAPLYISEDEYEQICERFTNREVVEWASKQESYRSSYSMTTGALKEKHSILTDASAA